MGLPPVVLADLSILQLVTASPGHRRPLQAGGARALAH